MMLTKNTAQSLGLTDRTDAEQSISGGARYLEDMMAKVPETVPEDERIWFALAAYNMGYAHMLDARSLTVKPKAIRIADRCEAAFASVKPKTVLQ